MKSIRRGVSPWRIGLSPQKGSHLPILLLMRKRRSTKGIRRKEKRRMRKRKMVRVRVKKNAMITKKEIMGKVMGPLAR